MCFGGAPDVVRDLCKKNWEKFHSLRSQHAVQIASPFRLARLKPGKAISDPDLLERAHGCLLGQVAGDALGAQVEFEGASSIHKMHPEGLRSIDSGGPWNTMAGQPTDDSELALLLARSIVGEGSYKPEKVAEAYCHWFHDSHPFDVGDTIRMALSRISPDQVRAGYAAEIISANASQESQSNGSLMRISPLGIYGYQMPVEQLWQLACEESQLTHPHPVCRQACALFTTAIARAVRTGCSAGQIYEEAVKLAEKQSVDPLLQRALERAADQRPDYSTQPGWVLVAFQNAFYELLHSKSLEEALVATVMQGGDTDTNAAIAGSLLGAVHGRNAIPDRWKKMVLSCRPHVLVGARQPRPFWFWPVDLPNLAELLLLCGNP